MSRRRFLQGAIAAAGALAARRVSAASEPIPAPVGCAAGDVTSDAAVVWSRADRPSRMIVEYALDESFRASRRVVGPAALEADGFTARLDLSPLPADRRVFYRVAFEDLAEPGRVSPPAAGSFRTAPAGRADVHFVWGADIAGQGWGIDVSRGGMRIFEAMRRLAPDFFLLSGDAVYADNPIPPEVVLDDGSVWRNLVTPAKGKVAETLDEFRGNYLYNLLDEQFRRFLAEVPVVAQWDDHETVNNWDPSRRLDEDRRYSVKSAALLAARAKRAFLEHLPLRRDPVDPERLYRAIRYGPRLELFVTDARSDRGANTENRQSAAGPETAFFGAAQLAWLKARLAASAATWKVVACSQPLGLLVPDGPRFDGVANADDGAPLGRELEIADLLAALERARVRNVVWLTGDVHYAAAHHYDPSRARFRDFHPFWEFVAGPLHAGTFGPAPLDATFGPEVRFLGIPEGMKPNRPPGEGLQFFGSVRVEGRSGAMTVRLHDVEGRVLFSKELAPEE